MTDAERRKAFLAERRRQVIAGRKIQVETFDGVVALLREAQRRITIALSGAPSTFEAWRLTAVQDEVRGALDIWQTRSLETILSGIDRSWTAGGDLVTAPLGAAGVRLDGLMPRLDPRLLDAMKAFQTDRIRDISATTVNRINTEIGLLALGAQSMQVTTDRVADALKAPADRARMIIRTELGTVYSAAGQQRMEQAVKVGVTGLQKKWRRSGKLHPRVTHELADGQIVDVDRPFLVGGIQIMYPRAPDIPAKERINCGCSSLPHMAHWRISQPGARPYTAEELGRSPAARTVEEVRAAP